MTTIDSSLGQQRDDSCAVDRSCADSGCGCSTPAGADQSSATTRRGPKAGLLAVACAVACLAVPFAVGGAAAVSGALAGEWWLVAGLAVAAIVVSVAVVRRRQTGKIC